MTYKDMYDNMLNECLSSCSMCERYGAARILSEVDPTAYRCGFVDYMDSISHDEILCSCGNRVDQESIINAEPENEVECLVCAGSHGYCDCCGEYIDLSDMYDEDTCKKCHANSV